MDKMKISLLLCLLLTSPWAHAQQKPSTARARVPAQTAPGETAAEPEVNTPAEENTETPQAPESEAAATPEAPATPQAPPATDSTQVNATTAARPRPMRLPVQSLSSWAVGLTTLQWNEKLTVSQLGTTTNSNLNFNGAGLVLQKETIYRQWGWNFGGMIAGGRANGGPFNNDVKIERQSFSMIALTPRIFWRLTNSVNVGGTAMIYMRNIDLPTGNGVEMTAGRKNNAGFLADMNLRIFKTWDFYQAIGPINDGAYLWKVGVNYRF